MKKARVILALVLLCLLPLSLWLNLRTGVYAGDHFLPRKGPGQFGDVTMTAQDGDWRFTGTVGQETVDALLMAEGDRITVDLGDGEPLTGTWDGERLLDESGLPLGVGEVIITINGQESPMSRYAMAATLTRMAFGAVEHRGSFWLSLMGAILYLLGAVTFLYPEQAHFFLSRWQYEHAELSDAGILAERIGAVVAMVGSAVVMFLPILV